MPESKSKSKGGKSTRHGAKARTQKRIRNYARLPARKDQHVFKSSHGKYASVAQLEQHRLAVTKPKPAPKEKP